MDEVWMVLQFLGIAALIVLVVWTAVDFIRVTRGDDDDSR